MGRKAVIFDLFGTLIKATSPENRAIEYFKTNVQHSSVQRKFCGALFDSKITWEGFLDGCFIKKDSSWNIYLENCCKSLKIDNTIKNHKKIYEIIKSTLLNDALSWIPEKRNEILEQLKKDKYILSIASNAFPPTLDFILNCTSLPRFIKKENIFVSYKIGKVKTDPDFYWDVLNKLDIHPEDAMIIGDSWKSDIYSSKKATKGKIGGILYDSCEGKRDIDGGINEEIKMNNSESYRFYRVTEFSKIPERTENFFNKIIF